MIEMVKHQRSQGLLRQCSVWWRSASRWAKNVTLVTAVVIGVTGSIAGIAAALPILEPYWYVSRGELRLVMDKQALATDRQTLYQLKGDLDRANKDSATAPSQTVRERIDELRRAIEETNTRVRRATGGQ